jgi:hypothetical protein
MNLVLVSKLISRMILGQLDCGKKFSIKKTLWEVDYGLLTILWNLEMAQPFGNSLEL